MARAEAVEKQAEAQSLAQTTENVAENAAELAAKNKIEVEKRAREERVRREAKEKAERERADEVKLRVEREREVERMRKDGGPWVLAEAGSGKKRKGKGVGMGSPKSSVGALVMAGVVRKEVLKENGKVGVGETEKVVESSGRAGSWGPKKILSRKEGAAVLLGMEQAADRNEK